MRNLYIYIQPGLVYKQVEYIIIQIKNKYIFVIFKIDYRLLNLVMLHT
jgi:hypothetical protein